MTVLGTNLGPAPPVPLAPCDTRPPCAPHPHREVLDLLRAHGIELGAPVGRGAGCTAWIATAPDGSAVAVKIPFQRSAADDDALAHEAEVLRHLHATVGDDHSGADAIVSLCEEVHARPQRLTESSRRTVRAPAVTEALVLTPCGDETLDQWWARTRRAAPVGTDGPSVLDDQLECALLHVVGHLVRGLVTMHGAGVVHGDLSPRNVVMCDDRPVIIDFGAATIDGCGGPMTHGTLPFAAPEVVAATAVGPASDLFALGRITTALVLGSPTRATVGPSLLDELRAAGCPPALADVAVRAQAPDPAGRPSASAWEAALDRDTAAGDGDGDGDGDGSHRTMRTAAPDGRSTGRRPVHGAEPDAARALTVEFGPRPPRPDPPRAAGPSRHRSRRVLTGLVAVGLAVVTLVSIAALAVSRRPAEDDAAPTAPSASSAPGDPTSAGTLPPLGELPVRWDAARAEATVTNGTVVTRYRIGAPGDQLVVGRWRCRGSPRPVLYRPSRGELYEFSGWADPHQPQPTVATSSGHAVGGHLRVALEEDGCERAVVDAPA